MTRPNQQFEGSAEQHLDSLIDGKDRHLTSLQGGKKMQALTSRVGACGLLASLVIGCSSFALDAAAERIEQTSLKSNPRSALRTATVFNDVPGHEVGQELQIRPAFP